LAYTLIVLSEHCLLQRASAGGAYVPTVFVGMYATQGRYESSQAGGADIVV